MRSRDGLLARALRAFERRGGIHLFRVVALDLAAAAPEPRKPAPASLMSEAEVLAWCADPALELDGDLVRSACARGDQCIGAFEDGRLAGYLWLAAGPAPHLDGMWIECNGEAHYTYKVFVRPEHRGRRLANALLAAAHRIGQRRGSKRSVALIALHNHASARIFSRCGYRTIGYAVQLRLPGFVSAFASRSARRAGVRVFLREPERQVQGR